MKFPKFLLQFLEPYNTGVLHQIYKHQHWTSSLKYIFDHQSKIVHHNLQSRESVHVAKSVRPLVRGSTDFIGGAYPPSKTSPSSPSRHSSYFATDGRQRPIVNSERRGHRCAPLYVPFVAKGVLYVVGLVRPAHLALSVNYHWLGW